MRQVAHGLKHGTPGKFRHASSLDTMNMLLTRYKKVVTAYGILQQYNTGYGEALLATIC